MLYNRAYVCGLGSTSDPVGGAYSTPRPLNWITKAYFWGEGREREVWHSLGNKTLALHHWRDDIFMFSYTGGHTETTQAV